MSDSATPPLGQADDWYVPTWLDEATALPQFEVIDTRSAQGRLDRRPKRVTMRDLILFHGHACDGLLRGAYALRALADEAFPGRPFDRSDLLVVSKNSPCLGDVAAYLTGGRARFGTHLLDADLGVGYIIKVRSTGEIWEVREEPGFFPALIAGWEAALVHEDRVGPEEKSGLVGVNEAAQWNWVRLELLPSRPADHYRVRTLDAVDLPAPLLMATRTDVVNRGVDEPADPAGTYGDDLDAPAPSSVVDASGSWRQRYLDGPPAADGGAATR